VPKRSNGAVSKCALVPSRPIPRSIRKSDFVPLSGLLSVPDNPFQSNPETKDGNGFKRETRLQEPPISGRSLPSGPLAGPVGRSAPCGGAVD